MLLFLSAERYVSLVCLVYGNVYQIFRLTISENQAGSFYKLCINVMSGLIQNTQQRHSRATAQVDQIIRGA